MYTKVYKCSYYNTAGATIFIIPWKPLKSRGREYVFHASGSPSCRIAVFDWNCWPRNKEASEDIGIQSVACSSKSGYYWCQAYHARPSWPELIVNIAAAVSEFLKKSLITERKGVILCIDMSGLIFLFDAIYLLIFLNLSKKSCHFFKPLYFEIIACET